MKFYIAVQYKIIDSGGIGLTLFPVRKDVDSTPDKNRTFTETLKKNGLIKKYF